MKTTDELLKILEKTENIDDYLNDNAADIIDTELKDYLDSKLIEKNLRVADVIARSNIAQDHVYKIFSGKRGAGRDKLLCICFGMGLNLQETQLALRLSGSNILYPKNKRDSLIIFAINNNANIIDCNAALDELGEKILE